MIASKNNEGESGIDVSGLNKKEMWVGASFKRGMWRERERERRGRERERGHSLKMLKLDPKGGGVLIELR